VTELLDWAAGLTILAASFKSTSVTTTSAEANASSSAVVVTRKGVTGVGRLTGGGGGVLVVLAVCS
jgi:hypothetical protein